MELNVSRSPVEQYDATSLVVTSLDSDQLSGTVAELDKLTDGYFSRLKRNEDLPVKVGKCVLCFGVPGLKAESVLVAGCGKEVDFDAGTAFRCAGAAAKLLAERKRSRVGFYFGNLADDLMANAIAGASSGCVGQDLFREERNLQPMDAMDWLLVSADVLERGRIVGDGILLARELVNLPANYVYPESFALRAAEAAIASGLELEIWDELRLRKEGCGALLAVAAGSTKPPRLVIARHAGTKKQPPTALVGKGVTFDSGGLSLKPSDSMLAMKCDMAGAATVLATMQTLARLQVSTPVIGVMGLVENMISGNCYKLGDVVTARSGKTIEIHNTDAEGRMVLADALNVAIQEKPARIVDLATLTGACLVALGTDVAGLMSNDGELENEIRQAADRVGELVWPLPMHDHFAQQIQSKVADIKNVGAGRWGGAITAAKFLEEFVEGLPWTHMDIAGPAFLDTPQPHLDAGGTGAMVRTLVDWIEHQS